MSGGGWSVGDRVLMRDPERFVQPYRRLGHAKRPGTVKALKVHSPFLGDTLVEFDAKRKGAAPASCWFNHKDLEPPRPRLRLRRWDEMADREQFIEWIADRFQAVHVPPLSRKDAVDYASGILRDFEFDTAPLGSDDFDWSEDAAHVVADKDIQHWESVA